MTSAIISPKAKWIIIQNLATLSMLEIIDYYIFNQSSVNLLMLDASKAFDRVNYCKLFATVLLKRNISPIVLRLLLFMYTHQSLHVK